MTREVKLPEISENAESGTVSEVLVSKGDHVDVSQPLIAVESDKATVEVPAEYSGTIKDILVKEDDEIKAGDVILILEADGDGEAEEKEQTKEDKDPAKGEKPSAHSEAKVEDKKESTTGKEQPEREDDGDAKKQEKEKPKTADEDIPAAPLARRLARELHIDLHEVKEKESKDSRITSNDIMLYVRHLLEQKIHNGEKKGKKKEKDNQLPDFGRWGDIEKESMSGIRKATARTTSQSWRNIPHVTQFDEADVTDIEKYRDHLKIEKEVKISLTAILIKLLAEGLKKFPKFNASIDMVNNEVIYKKYYNISVAVDTPKGLLMPVIRKVDEKNIQTIAEELKELVAKAIDGKLDQEAMEGGNISISNLGTIGGTQFTPVIFPPQVAILGVGGLKTIPRYNEEKKKFAPRKMLPLALSYDHRLIDGADAARFTHWLCTTLENPINAFVE